MSGRTFDIPQRPLEHRFQQVCTPVRRKWNKRNKWNIAGQDPFFGVLQVEHKWNKWNIPGQRP
jgi:hypothetical protein